MSKISVLIPAYNTGLYIGKCIESIQNQTYTNIDILVVDDGSTDGTVEIACHYAESDARIKVVSTIHKGVAEARNECLRNATGDYLLFVDSDDWIAPSLCENLYREAKRTSADIVFAPMVMASTDGTEIIFGDRSIVFNDNEVLTGPECFVRMVDAGYAYPMVAGNLYRLGLFADNHINFKGGYHEDEYSFPFLLKSAARVCNLHKAMYYYRQRRESIMNCQSNARDRVMALGYIAHEFEKELSIMNEISTIHLFARALARHIYRLKKKAQTLYDMYLSYSQKPLIVFAVNQSTGLSYGLGTYTRAICETVIDVAEFDFIGMILCCDIDSPMFQVDYGCPFYLLPDVKGSKTDYYKSVVYFMASRLKSERRIVFHLNYAFQLPLGKFAKFILNAQVLYTQHYMDWAINLGGNRELLSNELKNSESDITRKFNDERQMMNMCDRIIVVANHSYNCLKDIYGADCSKILILPHTSNVTKSKSNVALLRTKYNLSSEDRILLYVGRLDDNKNISSLLKAFANIDTPNVYLWIVGDGHLNLYLNEVAPPDWKRIKFWGFRKCDVVSEMYSIAEFGIVPSKYEEFGYVALEMMMSGLPVILNKTTGLEELAKAALSKTYNGDIQSLTAQIADSLQNKKHEQTESICHRLQNRYSPVLFKSSMIEVYMSLLD